MVSGAHRLPVAGIAFPVEELLAMQHWASERSLVFAVHLDQHCEEGEFEEVVTIERRGGAGRVLALWRNTGAVIACKPGRRPRRFADLATALDYAGPSRFLARRPTSDASS